MSELNHNSPFDPIVYGGPLSEEPGIGALTLGGYLREVTERFAEREALVMQEHEGVTRRADNDRRFDRPRLRPAGEPRRYANRKL